MRLTRRLAIMIGGVLGMLLALVAIAPWLIDGSAQEDRFIPIEVRQDGYTTTTGRPGDTCTMRHVPGSARDVTPYQIEITDEAGVLVALWTVEGELGEMSSATNTMECVATTELAVPEARFYTVYLDDRRIRSYAPDDFPIEERDRVTIDIQS